MWNPALEETLHPFHEFARADANIEVAELKGTNLVPADEIKGIPAVQIQETPLSDFFLILMLALGVFGIITTEMGIVGVLPQVANKFNITAAQAGWLVSIFALVVAIAGPFLTLLHPESRGIGASHGLHHYGLGRGNH